MLAAELKRVRSNDHNMFHNQEIHLALGFDENYINPIYALLASIFINNKEHRLIIHAIATGVSEDNKLGLKRYIAENSGEIFFYEVDEEEIRKNVVIPPNTHFTIATYYRLFFPSLVSHRTNRLLYIDSDTIIVGNLAELYYVPLNNHIVAAVMDPTLWVRAELGIHNPRDYFNAGVLLIDVQKWNDESITKKALEFIAANPEKIRFVDQDVLNAILIGRWLPVDRKFNLMTLDVKLQIPKKKIVKDAVIIHYTTPHKPWHCLTRNKLRGYYHYYLRRSPSAKTKKYIDFKWNYSTVRSFVIIRLKEIYFDTKVDKILPIRKFKNASPHDY